MQSLVATLGNLCLHLFCRKTTRSCVRPWQCLRFGSVQQRDSYRSSLATSEIEFRSPRSSESYEIVSSCTRTCVQPVPGTNPLHSDRRCVGTCTSGGYISQKDPPLSLPAVRTGMIRLLLPRQLPKHGLKPPNDALRVRSNCIVSFSLPFFFAGNTARKIQQRTEECALP